MERTLLDGDRVLVDTQAYGNRMPAPGDIVVLEYPADREKSFLQRCIAIAGQTVAVEDGVVYVDGIRFDEPEGAHALPGQDFGPEVVPDGHFFAMGDHRLISSDSRTWGTVPLDHLWGKVVQILIATDADSGRIRLDWTGAARLKADPTMTTVEEYSVGDCLRTIVACARKVSSRRPVGTAGRRG